MQTVKHFVQEFVPEHYNLFLDINRIEKTFSGNVAIQGEALADTISLHQKDLEIQSVKIDNHKLDFTVDHDNEALSIAVKETGNVTLVIEFSGNITDNMTGLYPSYYTINGIKKEVYATQFESHFAREVFPSVDEPEAKATFDLSIKFDAEENDSAIVLSNMPEINVELREETGVWAFDTTPKMSTYLLAFAIGDLQSVKAKTKNGTEVGIFSTKAHPLSSLEFALDIAKRSIDFYEDYFGIEYPIPLSYHLALPDFSAGAMENWGLVTYREIYLVVDENSSVNSRQQVALVIAHELAHQWFGNLVTMKWWDDLWLNESFANMMEYVAVDAIEPSWDILTDFQKGGVPLSLQRDATDGVQSVHVEVNHPDEINTLFDPAIVYAKGSRLMHMLRRWLGDDAFRAGLSTYFKTHQYGNTVGHDLWKAFSDVSGKDVGAFMDAWIEQPGYPVVNVFVEDNNLVLEQNQFFIGEHEDKDRLWEIPLNANWEELPSIFKERRIVIPNYSDFKAQNGRPLLLNSLNTAHFITNYSPDLFEALLFNIDHLDTTSRLQLVQERRLLADAGMISYKDLVGFLPYFENESSSLVLNAIIRTLMKLSEIVGEDEEKEQLNQLVYRLFSSHFQRLGFEAKENESDEDEFVRESTLNNLIKAEFAPALDAADQFFNHYDGAIEKIPASIRFAVLVSQIKRHETEELVNLYFDYYQNSTDGNLKFDIADALSYTKNANTVDRILEAFKNKDIIKPQDIATSWVRPMMRETFTQEATWNWIRANWDWIMATLGGDMSADRFVTIPSGAFRTSERQYEFIEFFEPKLEDMALQRMINMGIKEIAARVGLIEREKEGVKQTLRDLF